MTSNQIGERAQMDAQQVDSLQAGDPRHIGPYQLLGRLGSGGMGQVFAATGPRGPVAVKVVHAWLAHDEQFRARFAAEVKASRKVVGPWTAAVLDADPEADVPWLATEYVQGVPLDDAVRGAGPLPPAAVHYLASNLARALATIHAAGLVHRDVKPANVLLAADRPRLIDFGISRALDGTRMTGTGATIGTPAYMSPEQAEGRRIGTSSDLFSLGSVLVTAATGRGPFGSGTPLSMIRKVLYATPELGDLAEPVRKLVAACFARNPDARPTAAQLADALEPLPSSLAGGWMPGGIAALLPPPLPREPMISAAAAAEPPPVPGPVSGPFSGPVSGPFSGPVSGPQFATGPSGPSSGGWAPPVDAQPKTSRRRFLIGAGAIGAVAVGAGAGFGIPALTSSTTTAPTDGPGPAALPSGQPRELWTVTPGGKVQALAADAGAVYVSSDDASIYALDPATGRPKWTYAVRQSLRDPVQFADGGAVLVSDSYITTAVDAATGALRWENEKVWMLGSGGDLVVGKATTAGSYDNYDVIGLDPATGQERWRSPVGKQSGIGINDAVVSGGKVHVKLEGSLLTLDAANGSRGWEHQLTKATVGLGAEAYDITVVDTTLFYVTTETGKFTVVAIDTVTGQERWRRTADGSYNPGTLTVEGGSVIGGGYNSLVALDMASGEQRWQKGGIGDLDFPISGTFIAGAAGTIYRAGETGGIGTPARYFAYAYAADTGEERWKLRLENTEKYGRQPTTAVPGTFYMATGTDNTMLRAVTHV
ncbi:protein kinase domain-containing protein [Pseudonocardia sp. TRM90224]|uniref:protein kinase domain-containing protein n=1 Tax=Pseudonocardia sp. TRM90224 TaxID=2812678 RepID=UPI001E3C5522|nr:PQQ-binding-like beta-propeller repeat protein [Pseudonocardia sp. TRM90224]